MTKNGRKYEARQKKQMQTSIDRPRSRAAEALTNRYILRRKARGQALVIVALSMVALIAIIALAIDGGSMFNQRRVAQNGADGSAMAGTRQMLIYYEDMVLNSESDLDYYPTAAQAAQREDEIRAKITQYASNNGVLTSTVHAYFVDQNKNIVTAPVGEDLGQGNCGTSRPCEVGQNGYIPWTLQPRGILIRGQAQTDSFFGKIIGWNKVSAAANATAYMGVAVTSGYDVNLLPIGFFTDTDHLNALQPGNNYTLINGDDVLGSGNWGWINYAGSSPNATVLRAWLLCGFNPSITEATWPSWCPDYTNAHGEGPIYYWTGWPDGGIPIEGPFQGLTVRFGDGIDGWWVSGTTGTKSSACNFLGDIAAGRSYIVPVFDTDNDSTGSGLLYHLVRLAKFRISSTDIRCNGQGQHWNIQGVFLQAFSPGSSGWHGDLRRNSLHLIFMGP